MPKTRSKQTHFLCRECGGVQSRWMGKCPDCGGWDTLERYVEPAAAGPGTQAPEAGPWMPGASRGAPAPDARPILEVEAADVARLATGIGELDRVLGGGFVPGSVVLLGGDPGIGKSTLLLQAAAQLASGASRVLYVSSEESAYQTRLRAERLFAGGNAPADELFVLSETSLPRIFEQAGRVKPAVLVLDSIQMVYKPDLDAAPGSVTQLRRCCVDLVYLAKLSGMAVAVVGHVTKDGQLAGPKLLEHLVDAVISFEGDRHDACRVVRAVKNRFGATLEVGLFEMTGAGLVEVTGDPAEFDPGAAPRPGSVLCPVLQGTRCLMVEVQALTATGFLGNAKRKTSGLDGSRLAMLIAVLEQHAGLRLADQDVFASAVGGVRVADPAADLPLCLAIAGAHMRRAMPPGTCAVGEVGLGGEIRRPYRMDARERAAARLGCRTLVTGPITSRGDSVASGARDVVPVATIDEALAQLVPAASVAAASG